MPRSHARSIVASASSSLTGWKSPPSAAVPSPIRSATAVERHVVGRAEVLAQPALVARDVHRAPRTRRDQTADLLDRLLGDARGRAHVCPKDRIKTANGQT